MFKKNRDVILIVGCGRLGTTIVEYLSNERENIVIIDKNKENFINLPNSFSGFSLEGDATEVDTLLKAEIFKAKTLIVITDNDNTNLMIAQMGKKIYQIPQVIARVYDTKIEGLYKDLEIEIISPTRLFAEKLKKITI